MQAALEVLNDAQKTNLLEKRRSVLRLSALWFPLLGHVHIRSYPPPDYIGTLKLLLEHGARPDARDICGKTFIHYASGPLCIDAMVFEMMDAVIEASKLTDRVTSCITTPVACHISIHLPSLLLPRTHYEFNQEFSSLNFPHSRHNKTSQHKGHHGLKHRIQFTPSPRTLTRLLRAVGGAPGREIGGPTRPIWGGIAARIHTHPHTHAHTHLQ